MLQIPPKLLLFLGIFWMLTYVCIGAVTYIPYSQMDEYVTGNYGETELSFFQKVNQTLSFREWLNVNFDIAERIMDINYYERQLTTYEEEIFDEYSFQKIKDEHFYLLDKGESVFTRYGDGYTWYENSHALDKYYFLWKEIANPRWKIKHESYERTYFANRNLEYDDTGNFTIREEGWGEKAWELLISVPTGFVKLLEFLSFKITSIDGTEILPIEIRVILNCIFVPIHLLIAIGLSPYVAKLVEAIAKLIDSLTPLT